MSTLSNKEVYNIVFGSMDEFKRWKKKCNLAGTVKTKEDAIIFINSHKDRVKHMAKLRVEARQANITEYKQRLASGDSELKIIKGLLEQGIVDREKEIRRLTSVIDNW